MAARETTAVAVREPQMRKPAERAQAHHAPALQSGAIEHLIGSALLRLPSAWHPDRIADCKSEPLATLL